MAPPASAPGKPRRLIRARHPHSTSLGNRPSKPSFLASTALDNAVLAGLPAFERDPATGEFAERLQRGAAKAAAVQPGTNVTCSCRGIRLERNATAMGTSVVWVRLACTDIE